MKKYLEFVDGASAKFWSVKTNNNEITVVYGKIGTAGKADTKVFPSAEAAEKEALKQAYSKMKKGYIEKDTPVVSETEASLIQKPVKAKKTKTIAKSEPLADVVDDGIPKEWHSGKFWDACFRDEEDYPEEYEQAEKREESLIGEEEENKKFTVNDIEEIKYAFLEACEDGELEEAKEALDKLYPLLEKNDLKKILSEGIANAHGRVRKADLERFDVIDLLLKEGAELLKPGERCNLVVAIIAKRFLESAGTKTYREIVDEYFREFYKKIADAAIKLFRKAIDKVAKNKYKTEAVQNGKLSVNSFGFRIDASYDEIQIRVTGTGSSTELEHEAFSGIRIVDSDITYKYFPEALLPLINELDNEGLFNTITTTGHITISTENGKIFFEKLVDPQAHEMARKILEKQLGILETTEDWTGTEKLLKPTIKSYLINGFDPDGSRCLEILRRYLYCGESEVEVEAYQTLSECKKYGDYYPDYLYEEAMHDYNEFSWGWFEKNMYKLATEFNYEPAKQKLAEWEIEEKFLNYEDRSSTNDEENKDEEPLFAEKYTEEDLFTDTDTIIARADNSGKINIRFKIEGLQGYSDALDYLNNLMLKGYSHYKDGYELTVFFIDKPIMPKLTGYIPKTPELAFFSKAVLYKELHEKIRIFVNTTVKLYDHYHNLDGEWSTVAGTFAAIAAFMYDVSFMDLALKLAKETDGEHEEIAAQMALDVKKKYGVTKDTVAAIYELGASSDHGHFTVCKELYTVPENLEAFMEHYTTNFDKNFSKSHLVRFVNNTGSTKSLLKKIREYFNGTDDDHIKMVYADFYNLLLEVMGEEDNKDYGEPLTVVAKEKNSIEIEVFQESKPVIITADEASERYGIKKSDISKTEGRGVFVFAPSVVTNPYIYDFIHQNREKISKIPKEVCSTYTCYSGDSLEIICKNWAFDLSGAACQYGMIVADGKNKPVILYGILDYADIVRKFGKKSTNDIYLLEELRVANIKMECPTGSPVPAGYDNSKDFLAKADWAFYRDRDACAQTNLNKISKDSPEYSASLLIRASLMKKRKDSRALYQIYTELLELEPSYREYWENELKKVAEFI